MTYKTFLLLGILCYFLISLTGCLSLGHYGLSEDSPNMLAKTLKMRENYWYVLENNRTPALFYNDFQDYVVIIKAPYRNSTNIMYKRVSLDQHLMKFARNIVLPPECKGICTHFLYEGQKALFFDLNAFCDKYGGDFMEFIIADGKDGFCYFRFARPLKSCEWYFTLPSNISCYHVLQAEPDFHLLDLSSVKKN